MLSGCYDYTTKIRIIKRYKKFCGGNLYDNLDY